MHTGKETVAALIVRIRGDLSHDRFAAELGTSRQTVINWEKGTAPTATYRRKLAAYSGEPESAFVYPKEERPTLAVINGKLDRVLSLLERDEGAAVDARFVREARAVVEAAERRVGSVSRGDPAPG